MPADSIITPCDPLTRAYSTQHAHRFFHYGHPCTPETSRPSRYAGRVDTHPRTPGRARWAYALSRGVRPDPLPVGQTGQDPERLETRDSNPYSARKRLGYSVRPESSKQKPYLPGHHEGRWCEISRACGASWAAGLTSGGRTRAELPLRTGPPLLREPPFLRRAKRPGRARSQPEDQPNV